MKGNFVVIISIITFIFGGIFDSSAQELNCRVSVNHSRIQGTNSEIYQSLQRDINEFMNNTVWTENVFSINERIECQFTIVLSEYDGIDKFKGTLTVQSTRPIYNTNYKSVMLNHKEKDDLFVFEYVEGQKLEYNENAFLNNLTSTLAFYAYIIIGLDYDSFGNNAGSPYFIKAREVVNNAQSAAEPGWKAFEGTDRNNRYYMAETILDNANAPLRKFSYRYHRLGLDRMQDKLETGRNEITSAMQLLQSVHRRKPDSFYLKILMNTKLGEFVNIYSDAPQTEKQKVYNILKEIDPTSPKIEKLLQQQK